VIGSYEAVMRTLASVKMITAFNFEEAMDMTPFDFEFLTNLIFMNWKKKHEKQKQPQLLPT
jgi:hypothetical protein